MSFANMEMPGLIGSGVYGLDLRMVSILDRRKRAQALVVFGWWVDERVVLVCIL